MLCLINLETSLHDNREIAALTFLSGQTVDVKDDVGGAQVKGHLEQTQGMSFISYQVRIYFIVNNGQLYFQVK